MAIYTATTCPMIIPGPAAASQTTTLIAFGGARPWLAKRVEWYNPQAVGNLINLQDLNGNTIIQGDCEVASQSQILWTGPQKLTLAGKQQATNTAGSVQVVWQSANTTNANSSLIIWY